LPSGNPDREELDWLNRAKSGNVPSHMAFIMDGNGRWAERRGLSRKEGHKAGVEAMRRCLPALLDLGIKYVTLFVFSTENWRRPQDEVKFLMNLVLDYANSDRKELIENGVRLLPVGRWRELPLPVVEALSKAARDTANGSNLTVLLAVNYGGRQEILDAAKKLALKYKRDELDGVGEDEFRQLLYAPFVPDPDLIVRTSGEERISNFLLWQGAYSELVFTDVLWPDFGPMDIYKAVAEYGSRHRRFGDVRDKRG
jgi:undecaprenyl diphosphate synthase